MRLDLEAPVRPQRGRAVLAAGRHDRHRPGGLAGGPALVAVGFDASLVGRHLHLASASTLSAAFPTRRVRRDEQRRAEDPAGPQLTGCRLLIPVFWCGSHLFTLGSSITDKR
jgi:hypothetical protein